MSIETSNSINNNKLLRIRSNYILQEIFDYLNETKFLNFIRYNKSIQYKLDKGINDYRVRNDIIIELIPFKLSEDTDKEFINIKYDKNHYHIYFNGSKDEIKKNYFTKNDGVKIIKIVLDYSIESINEIFSSCKWIKKVYFIKFRRKNIINLNNLFEDSNVEEIHFYDFPKNYMTSTNGFFRNCTSLKNINFYKFDTSKVTDMSNMFYNCNSLENLFICSFDTSKVTTMKSMFYKCSSLKNLIIANVNTINVTNMSNMFVECKELEELDLSRFSTENVIDMTSMICKCDKLKKINVSSFSTENVIEMKNFLSGNSSIEEIDVSNFNFGKVKDLDEMFNSNASLKRIKMPLSQIKFAEYFDKDSKEKMIFDEVNENVQQNIQPINLVQNLGTIDNIYTILQEKRDKVAYKIYSVIHNQTQTSYLIEVYNHALPSSLIDAMRYLIFLKHPYIKRVIGHGNGPIALNIHPQVNKPYIVYENITSNFSLYDYIKDQKFTEIQAKLIFKKILEGVRFMHNANICHRHLNLNAILLDENHNPKISDFYSSCINKYNLDECCGFAAYKAPEVISNKPYDGILADIFCLGQILFNLVNHINGFGCASSKDHYYKLIILKKYDQYWNILGRAYGVVLSQEFKNLFIKMVDVNPDERPTIEEILNDEWMKEINHLNEEERNALENEIRNEFELREQHLQPIQQMEQNNINLSDED